MAELKKALVERLFAAHGRALQAFLYRRIRHQPDASDLVQEVYVRMLRLKNPDSIRDMQAYLFTVASNLAKEHAARESRRGMTLDLDDGTVLEELAESAGCEAQIDVAHHVQKLRNVLRQLPPRWHAAIVMQYVQGLSRQEIAERLAVSPRTVKKYLAQALGRCRRQMARLG